MRVGIIGGGAIARLLVQQIDRGSVAGAQVVAIAGRSAASRGVKLAAACGGRFVTDPDGLIDARPEVVVEAAGHEAVRGFGEALLAKGISIIVLSGGALCDDALRERLERAASASGSVLYVPSGGIGGLDALKAACAAGVDEVTITVTKPPAAWKGIDFVAQLKVDLDALAAPLVLYEGSARDGVPLFPANVNIAAVLSMAGIGFERTRLKAMAVPGLTHNTHVIDIKGAAGRASIKMENVPSPENPKTALLACYSAVAALKLVKSNVRYGT